MQKYQNNVISSNGRPLQGVSVLVVNYPLGTNATIYADNGVTVTANPLTTDANGAFAFYAADGHYSLQLSGTGITPQTISDILLSDPIANGVGVGGSTANRPNPPKLYQLYFDTTLGYEIECKQVSPAIWVNAAGVQV